MNGLTRPFNFAVNMNEDYSTTIFAASYLHFSDINLIDDRRPYIVKNHSDVSFVFVNTPSSAKNTLARARNMAVYFARLFSVTRSYSKETKEKPDLIYASSPHPLALIAGIKIARKYKVPCVCEIRDLWPEAIFAFGKIKERSILGKILIKGEHWIYKNASAIVFLKEGDTDYLKERKWTTEQGGDISLSKCHYINNGVDLNVFNAQISDQILEDRDLLGDKFNVVYTGAIRPINNVGNILDAAKLLEEYEDIQFLVYGDGNQLEPLRQRVEDECLSNVKMKGYVDKKYIPYILSRASVNILNYSQSKYNWTRGNSSNKLFEYMASGKPIISTVKMGYCPVNRYKCGLSLKEDTPNQLAEAILNIHSMSKGKYNEVGENAQMGARDFDYKILTGKLILVMESLIS